MGHTFIKLSHDLYEKVNFTINNFRVKLVETDEEYDETLRMRFEVFNLEMGEGLASSEATGRDEDDYDKYCDHLIVKDIENNEKIVATYRILTKHNALEGIGFYSETEFDISNLKNLDAEIIELGRTCVHKDYRSKHAMTFLWAGLSRVVELTNAKYLFGCGSIHSNDINDISRIYRYFKDKYLSDEKYRVYPLEKNRMKELDLNIPLEDEKKVFRMIPPILKGYIRVSAVCCGEPAWDPEFGCADLLIMLNAHNITKRYTDHFMQKER